MPKSERRRRVQAPKWSDDDWAEPELPGPPELNRGMRRLALAVLLQAALDFTEAQDRQTRLDAETFLFPVNPDRQEDFRWTVEISALDPRWLHKHLTQVREQTPLPPEARTCSSCREPRPISEFYVQGSGRPGCKCKSCLREQTLRRRAALLNVSIGNRD